MNQEREIKEMVERYVRTIETQDKADFCGLWADTPDCVLISIANQYVGVERIYQGFFDWWDSGGLLPDTDDSRNRGGARNQ